MDKSDNFIIYNKIIYIGRATFGPVDVSVNDVEIKNTLLWSAVASKGNNKKIKWNIA